MQTINHRFLYFLAMSFFAIPLLLISSDVWDGAMVSYGFRVGDLSGIKVMYFESGWYLQYYLYKAVYIISINTYVSAELLVKLITIFSVFGISIEVKKLSNYLFELPKHSSYVSACFVLIFPAWFVLVSNVLVIHVLCMFLLLFGYRLVMVKRNYILGTFFIILSFQLASNFMLFLGLLISDYFLRKSKNKTTNIKYLCTSIFLTVALFIFTRELVSGSGEYSNYNKLAFDMSIFKPFIASTVYFGVFIITLISIPLIFLLKNFKDMTSKDDLLIYAIIFLLIICAAFPYAALGKSPYFMDFYNWNYRQSFLLSIPISLFIGYIYFKLDNLSFLEKNKNKFYFTSLTVVIFCTFLFVGYAYKFLSEFHRNAIIYSFKQIEKPPNGIIGLNIKSHEAAYLTKIRPYEFNALLQKAFGRAEWMVSNVRLDNDVDIFHLKEWQRIGINSKEHKIKNVSRFFQKDCKTVIEITQNRKIKPIDIFVSDFTSVYHLNVLESVGKNCLIK